MIFISSLFLYSLDTPTPPCYSQEVHSGCDVVDLDVSPDGLFVATIGATDAKGLVSQAKDGAKYCELEWIRNDYRSVNWNGSETSLFKRLRV